MFYIIFCFFKKQKISVGGFGGFAAKTGYVVFCFFSKSKKQRHIMFFGAAQPPQKTSKMLYPRRIARIQLLVAEAVDILAMVDRQSHPLGGGQLHGFCGQQVDQKHA